MTDGSIDHMPDNNDDPTYEDGLKKETVAELWNMRCPGCGSDEHISVSCMRSAMLTHDGTEEFGDSEWDQDSHARCTKCDYSGYVHDFDADNPSIRLDGREKDTVVAALRHWQNTCLTAGPEIWEIARNQRKGESPALNPEEIDDLCERLNR
jgi:hypothetical protein